jgi:hypothetical protein
MLQYKTFTCGHIRENINCLKFTIVKNLLTLLICFLCANACLAQQVEERKNVIIDDIIERYQATIDSNGVETKVGAYTAFRGKKIIASGQYKNGKRTGTWYYYDHDGKLLQQYDHDNNKLLFEAPEANPSNFRYLMDETITYDNEATQPIKIGGRYFGYLPYLTLIRHIHALRGMDETGCKAVLTILVSPLGRLADCSVQLFCNGAYPVYYTVDADALPEIDKRFIPGVFNGHNIATRITILCKTDKNSEVNIY